MAASSLAAVEAEGVGYAYGKKRVLDNISLRLEEGGMYCVLGPNGSGKTTLFKILSTIFALQDGEISIAGRSLREFPTPIRRKIGVLFQNPAVDMKLTVRENLRHHGHLYGLESYDLEKRITKNLEALGIEDRGGDFVESLSGGLRRRVEIARALASDPKFILLDEPFAGIDPIAVEDLQSIVAKLKTKNIGILITDHNVQETLSITDRAYLMVEGSIMKSGTAQELASDDMVRKVYLGSHFELRRKVL